ncbi:MAG TPA: ABC transporter substrate-binding protein [Stellaceae bacterium]|nr:ABC transporter substrate-binding protein [Stellaceae bacterium]
MRLASAALGALGLLLITALGAAPAGAAPNEVVIGALYPLSGGSAPVGLDDRHALETAVDLVNNSYDLDLPLAKTSGLPHLGGAKIRVIIADHQGDPQKGRAEAERLITQEKVVALIGAYQSAVSATVAQTAERYGVPFLCADSTSPSLTQRGFKWFFRPTAHDLMFSTAMFDFIGDMEKKTGKKVASVSLIAEDTLFGTDSRTILRKLAEERGIKVAADIKYRANSPSLTAEVQELKAANAPVLMPSSYTSDAILMMKTMSELGWRPKAIVAQAAGFADQALVDAVGPAAEGIISRSSFATDVKNRPAIGPVNEMFKKRANKDLNDSSGRVFTGLIILADAIDRARSTDPAKIRAALQATDMPGSRTIMPWKGVKFDANGQNTEATPIITQIKNGKWRTIWPFDVASEPAVWNVQ